MFIQHERDDCQRVLWWLWPAGMKAEIGGFMDRAPWLLGHSGLDAGKAGFV